MLEYMSNSNLPPPKKKTTTKLFMWIRYSLLAIKSSSFCPGHANNEKELTTWLGGAEMLENLHFLHFFSQNQDNKALPQVNLASPWLSCVRSDRDKTDYTNRRSKSSTKYAPIADHNRVHKGVSHALAVSHVVGLQDDVHDLSRVDCRQGERICYCKVITRQPIQFISHTASESCGSSSSMPCPSSSSSSSNNRLMLSLPLSAI